MVLGAPQLVLLGIITAGLGLDLARNGQPKEGKHSFWITAISSAIQIGLLYWGGFFG